MASREKLAKIIHQRQLVSYANNTRWGQLVEAMAMKPFQCRVKWVFIHEPSAWGRLGSPVPGWIELGNSGPIPFREIEWLEVDTIERQHQGALVADLEIDHSEELDAMLHRCKLTFARQGTIHRVLGYEAAVSRSPNKPTDAKYMQTFSSSPTSAVKRSNSL